VLSGSVKHDVADVIVPLVIAKATVVPAGITLPFTSVTTVLIVDVDGTWP